MLNDVQTLKLTTNYFEKSGMYGLSLQTEIASCALLQPDVVASEKTDVWSFGCMLLKMATGENPYLAELDEDRIARLMRVRRAPHAGSARAKELPQELQEILNSCLSFDPATRPTFAELNDRFQLLKIGVS